LLHTDRQTNKVNKDVVLSDACVALLCKVK